jgi:hypothetical protein
MYDWLNHIWFCGIHVFNNISVSLWLSVLFGKEKLSLIKFQGQISNSILFNADFVLFHSLQWLCIYVIGQDEMSPVKIRSSP